MNTTAFPTACSAPDEHIAGTDPSQGIELCAVRRIHVLYELIRRPTWATLSLSGIAWKKSLPFNCPAGTFRDDNVVLTSTTSSPTRSPAPVDRGNGPPNGVDANLYGAHA
jgi:hypothetical protein